MIVNKYGGRFGNESANHDAAMRAFHYWDSGRFEWQPVDLPSPRNHLHQVEPTRNRVEAARIAEEESWL